MWSPILGLVFGAIGWFLVKFLFEPFKEIADLRREVQEWFIVYGDLKPDASPEERRTASESARRIGAGLVSHHYASQRWFRKAFELWPRWDIHSAGKLMVDLSRVIIDQGFSRPNLLGQRYALIPQYLDLPLNSKSLHEQNEEEAMRSVGDPQPY